jgi:hypothetical protein
VVWHDDTVRQVVLANTLPRASVWYAVALPFGSVTEETKPASLYAQVVVPDPSVRDVSRPPCSMS